MAKYVVYGYLTISVTKVVEAKTRVEARKLAQGLAVPSLCCRCEDAGEDDNDTWELNGFDDPPDDCVQDVEDW